MFADETREFDERQLADAAGEGEIIVLALPQIGPQLLIDTRNTDEVPPMVAVVPPVSSVPELYHWLGFNRGQFGLPQSVAFGAWPRSVRSLVRSEFIDILHRRFSLGRHASADEALSNVLTHLEAFEQDQVRQAVVGNGPWATLWSRPGSEPRTPTQPKTQQTN